jgi:hypothetical protein
MKTSDLIGTIKGLMLERMGSGVGILNRPQPPKGTPMPLGATFGGGHQPRGAPVAATPKPAAPAQNTANPRAPNFRPQAAAPTQTASTAQSSNPRAPGYTRSSGRAQVNSTPGGTVASTSATKVAAAPTQTKPATTTAPKPVTRPAPKPAAKRPVAARPRPTAKPIKRAQSYRQAADAGSSLSGAHQASLRESLLKEIKCIAKKKNTKKKSNEGDSPKGTPDQVEINPTIVGSFSNR